MTTVSHNSLSNNFIDSSCQNEQIWCLLCCNIHNIKNMTYKMKNYKILEDENFCLEIATKFYRITSPTYHPLLTKIGL